MNKTVVAAIVVLVLAVFAVLGYKFFYKPTKSVLVRPAPTPVADNLKQQLMLTEDDGGKADFNALSQDATGL
ncbi:hypothetical protein HZB69_00050 [Candidatus Amesbacteria bacterium]|nr:hypothetical protein [Candidatus Amesbacteria bacterium]